MLRFAFLLLLALPLSAAEFTTLAGKVHSGTITGIADGNLTVKTAKGDVLLPMKELASVDFGNKPAESEKYDELELTDGGILRISAMKIVGREALPTVGDGKAAPKATIPLESLSHWMRNGHETALRAPWRDLISKKGKRDQYVLRVENRFDPVPGTVLSGNDAGNEIEFQRETDNQKTTYRLARATGGLIFYHPPRGAIPTTLCKLTDAFGNKLIVHSLSISGTALTVKTVSDATVVYPEFSGISKLDFSSGNIVLLSEIRPDVNAPPAEKRDRNWTVVNDRSLDGPGFRLRESIYTRGVRIAPDVTAAYKLDGEYREFRAVVGVDDSVKSRTSPSKLVIIGDEKTIFSETISFGDPPRELNLDVKSVKLLSIRVEGEGAVKPVGITLADAKLQK